MSHVFQSSIEVPVALVIHPEAKTGHVGVYATLMMAQVYGRELTVNQLADVAGVSKNTLVKYLRELESMDFIEIQHRYSEDGAQLANKYIIKGVSLS
jgi:DNA-binding IscR family transcriptional regulator